jgi:hypothetical protein
MAKNVNVNEIENKKVRNIIEEIKNANNDINDFSNMKLKSDIVLYSKYISSILNEKEINKIIGLLDKSKEEEIIMLWKKLSNFNRYNDIFEIDLLEALENSFFEYSLIEISINMEANLKKFEDKKKNVLIVLQKLYSMEQEKK